MSQPIKAALIGAGRRSQTLYQYILGSEYIRKKMHVVAVCDPIKENCDKVASSLGAKPYYNIHSLVRDNIIEAALVVTPVESHHSLSVFLSSHGIHNLVETTWCSFIEQADQMISVANSNNVIVRVAENFFRTPIDRFAQHIATTGEIGNIGRIFCYGDHTGYHNNSRWIRFFQSYPEYVQAFEHTLNTIPFNSTMERHHETETYRCRHFFFSGNRLVIDAAANIKGFLGRIPRPGYTEWQGSLGTLVQRSDRSSSKEYQFFSGNEEKPIISGNTEGEGLTFELRKCSDRIINAPIKESEEFSTIGGGSADEVSKIDTTYTPVGLWKSIYCKTASGNVTVKNLHSSFAVKLSSYGKSINSMILLVDHIYDFCTSSSKLSEFDDQDALMSLHMEIGAKESALIGGARIDLPIKDTCEVELLEKSRLKLKYGVDPMDIEGMLNLVYPRP